jgi:hypothetical protein
MDADLSFPAPRVSDPPPLLDALRIEMLEDEDVSQFPLTNPLSTDNIPNTDAARVAIHSLARLREALSSPWNTPDRTFDRATWLRLVHELLIAVHEGLRNAQLASPDFRLTDAFDDLKGGEGATAGRVYDVLSGLTHFFWSDREDTPSPGFLKTHCFRCIKSASIPPLPELMRSIQLTTELDRRRVRETLLNEMIQEVHREVDEWRTAQRTALLDRIVELITGDPAATPASLSCAVFEADPRLRAWVDRYGDDMRSHVRRTIARDVDTDTIEVWAQEHLGTLLLAKRTAVELEAAASFDRQAIWDAKVAELTAALDKDLATHRASMVKAGQSLLDTERAAMTAATDAELALLRNNLKVKMEEEKARGETHLPAAVRRSARLAEKPEASSAINRAKKVRVGKKRKTALTLESGSSSGESDCDSGSLYAPSSSAGLSESIHAPSPSRSDPTPTAAAFPRVRPDSTTPTPRAPVPSSAPTQDEVVEVAAPSTPAVPLDPLAQILAAISKLSGEVAAVKDRVGDIESGKTVVGEPPLPSWADAPDDPMPDADEELAWARERDRAAEEELREADIDRNLEKAFSAMVAKGMIAPLKADEGDLGDLFPDRMRPALREMGWDMLAPFSDVQLAHMAAAWARSLARDTDGALLRAQEDSFYGFTHTLAASDKVGFALFTAKFVVFCEKFGLDPLEGLQPPQYVFFRGFEWSFGTGVSSPSPTPLATRRVRFESAPPIATLPPPSPSPAPSQSPAPPRSVATPGPSDFPDLGWSAPVSYASKARGKGKGKAQADGTPLPLASSLSSSPSVSLSPSPAPGSLVGKVKPKGKPQPRPLPAALATTEYVVILDHSAKTPSLLHTIDPAKFVRATQDKLRAVKAPLNLLSGRWSAPNSFRKNFVFVFAEKLEFKTISTYDWILFDPFGPNCRGVPNSGFASVMFNGVPCFRGASGSYPDGCALLHELMYAPVCHGRTSLNGPRWLRDPETKPAAATLGSVVWSFYDPTGEGLELMLRRPPSMFGRQTRAQRFENRPTLVQCTRCLRLGHSVGRCPKPSGTVVCPLCGGPHTLAAHAHRCPLSSRHPGASCDCPVTCFLCREKGKDGSRHGALSDTCPLKGAFRASRALPPPSATASQARVDNTSSDAAMVPPTPDTVDMAMVTDPAVLASLASFAGPLGSSTIPPVYA